MAGIYRMESGVIEITPTATLDSGTVVKVGRLVGVTHHSISANEEGEIQLLGEYDVSVSNVNASVGDTVTVSAKTLDGSEVSVVFGYAVRPILSTDTVARVRIDHTLNGLLGVIDSKIAPTTLTAPTVEAAASGSTGATLSGLTDTRASGWQYRQSTSEGGLESASATFCTPSPSGVATISGLSASTSYYWQVRSVADGYPYVTSEWSSAVTATTAAGT